MDSPMSPDFKHWIRYTFEFLPHEFDNIKPDVEPGDWDEKTDVEYMGRLFAAPVESTQGYTDAQINRGLWLLINESGSDLYYIFDRELPLDLRIKVVQDMYVVFEQLFLPRCTSARSAYQKKVDHLNPLNSVCYMWWDISPFYAKSGQGEREFFDSYCLEVMQKTLALDSIACQESALHGLGHWASAYPEFVEPTIDAFLQRQPNIEPELREYALAARWGGVM
jgi:hypothetical protein